MAISYKRAENEGMFEDFSVTVNGKAYNGYYSPVKIDRKSLPRGVKAFSMRYSCDDDSVIRSIMPNYCIVNHHGDFVTRDNLELKEETIVEEYSFM